MTSDRNQYTLQQFRRQADLNTVYRSYLEAINCDPDTITRVEDIPFLPIELFKKHDIKTGNWRSEHIFQSSGTTSNIRSKHHIKSIDSYLHNARNLFESAYGAVNEYAVLALLPGYANESSLVTMVDHLIQGSQQPLSGFFQTATHTELFERLKLCKSKSLPTVLIGVTFSLMNFASEFELEFPKLIIIETGGMKGRHEELTRKEIHDKLKKSFSVPSIHSEYGMTELLSQAYSKANGLFSSNPMFRVVPGDLFDPLALVGFGRNCRLNVIDLANTDTCCFIATGDVGKVYEDGSFEVLGRMDFADVRGCNLMTF